MGRGNCEEGELGRIQGEEVSEVSEVSEVTEEEQPGRVRRSCQSFSLEDEKMGMEKMGRIQGEEVSEVSEVTEEEQPGRVRRSCQSF